MVTIRGRVPERGDIIKLELNPRTGREQSGFRPAIVVSPIAYNRLSSVILICPITSRQKGWPFEVVLSSDMKTSGVVISDQIRTVDCKARKARFVEMSPQHIVDEVLGKIESLTR